MYKLSIYYTKLVRLKQLKGAIKPKITMWSVVGLVMSLYNIVFVINVITLAVTSRNYYRPYMDTLKISFLLVLHCTHGGAV